ncbi:Uncharacterised protein [Escherichia coli]|uniref:UPF0509 protein YciZ n=1 Tax=Escherichia coli TaxID=562 RepID=A0A376THN5_ECOLX|nr:Uncharacterised protein [Escherichia coli]
MSEFDAQRVAERIDIVLDILVAGDYHSAIHNLEILKAEPCARLLNLRQTSRRHRGRLTIVPSGFLFEDARRVSIFLFSIITL